MCITRRGQLPRACILCGSCPLHVSHTGEPRAVPFFFDPSSLPLIVSRAMFFWAPMMFKGSYSSSHYMQTWCGGYPLTSCTLTGLEQFSFSLTNRKLTGYFLININLKCECKSYTLLDSQMCKGSCPSLHYADWCDVGYVPLYVMHTDLSGVVSFLFDFSPLPWQANCMP